MSLLHPREPENEYTEREQHRSLIGRRMEAFASRSREPGDATTWEIVLASLMGTLLIICYSVADRPMLALVAFGLLLIWMVYCGIVGRVNVFSVLWGSSTTESHVHPDHLAIFRSSAVVALFTILSLVVDAVTGWGFGYYGIALVLIVIIYIIVVYRTWIAPIST